MRNIILTGLIRFSNSGFLSLLGKKLNQLVFFDCSFFKSGEKLRSPV
ncbi:MAG: hypothetical protein V7L05_07280 [Nostoc sp.]